MKKHNTPTKLLAGLFAAAMILPIMMTAVTVNADLIVNPIPPGGYINNGQQQQGHQHQSGEEGGTPPSDPILQGITNIFAQHQAFLQSMDIELQDYIAHYGDLAGFVFTQSELNSLIQIYQEIGQYLPPAHPGGDFTGYNGWDAQSFGTPPLNGMTYILWINHSRTPIVANFVSGLNMGTALLLGAMLGLQTFNSVAFRVLYGISFFLRNFITGVGILQYESQTGTGIKLFVKNYYSPCFFIPEFGWLDHQSINDIPPNAQGTVIIPDPQNPS